jgi:hypothetical protein
VITMSLIAAAAALAFWLGFNAGHNACHDKMMEHGNPYDDD